MSYELNKMKGGTDKALSLAAIGTLKCDLVQGLKDCVASLPFHIDLNMDRS